ncbi:MAG: hypothetical protein ACT4QF_00185 [Sporichthyaceae bacterium]|jgi:hypothetical protein
MNRFLDPLGLIDGTWDWTSDHGGAGIAAFFAAGLVALVHLAVLATLVALLVNARGVAEAARGFAQGVNEPAPAERR